MHIEMIGNTKKIVLDASFVAKVIGSSSEKEQEKCNKIIGQNNIYCPGLLRYDNRKSNS